MRLLNVHTMKLEEYFGFQIPRYDILSHCWGAEEVTFQKFNDSEWWAMRGATKIKLASSYCEGQGLDYIWIDTCCIDKSSSAELSEAINFMYGWYEGSDICYAYLEDVELALRTNALEDPAKHKAIRNSRWFNRGWTLQELIAPTKVHFFDTQWRSLGSKEDLSSLLSSITTIPEDVLAYPENRLNCSVARKMTWAAKRQTTRIEDVAYSLLGIFDVNMPLLYGEGQKAFIRLQEEILKETDDQSLLAWGLTGNAKWDLLTMSTGVFATSPAAFLGSEDVVPIPSKPGGQPQTMTSRGVRIELPLWSRRISYIGPTKKFAILDCQYKNDFSCAIGIPVHTTRDQSIFRRDPVTSGLKCPTLNFSDAEIRPIYLSKRGVMAEPRSDYTERETCVIRAKLAEEKGYDIFPIGSSPGVWVEETKVLKMEYTYDTKMLHRQASGAIAFSNPETKSCFIVIIDIIDGGLGFQPKIRIAIKIFYRTSWSRSSKSEDMGQRRST